MNEHGPVNVKNILNVPLENYRGFLILQNRISAKNILYAF